MRLHLVTAPTVEPVTLEEARLHRRVDDSADDALITELIAAGRQIFEGETGRQLITATWRLDLDAFPASDRLPVIVPKAPLLTVTSITYLDSSGNSQTWSASEYTVRTYDGPFARPGMVYPSPDEEYPDTYPVRNAVSVNFTAGYGADASLVPESVKATIKEMVGDLYEERESFIVGTTVSANPSFTRMLNRFRVPVYA